MGLLDNNKVITTPSTGLEGSNFRLLISNEAFDMWEWYREKSTSKNLALTFRDIFGWYDTANVYLVKGKITDTPTSIAINTTNFPNLREYSGGGFPKVKHIIACPWTTVVGSDRFGNVKAVSATEVRVCVIFENGQVYHNYPTCFNDHDFYSAKYATTNGGTEVETLFTKFDESVIWDIAGRKNPTNDLTLVSTGAYYYNPALEANAYEMHPALNTANGYGNTVGFGSTTNVNPISTGANIGLRARFWFPNRDDVDQNSFTYMGGYITDNLFTMVATYRNNKGSKPCRMCVFGTQDGGRSWFNMYEFASADRMKIDATYTDADTTYGAPLAQTGNAGSDIYSIRRRNLIIPTATAKEPSDIFEYDNAINVESIIGTSESITITTASAHGLKNGDAVVVGFQSGVSDDDRAFDWMVNDSVSATSGGNGVLLKVKSATTTTFVATLYIHNPQSGLPVRHIHALNRCKDGVSISCGEWYPCGWIIYNAIQPADAFAGYNVASSESNKYVRLTSTSTACQRPLGVIVEQDGKDTYAYIGMDNSGTEMNDVEMPEGRTESFRHNSCGVWKVLIDGIDSQKDNGEILYQGIEPSFGFQQVNSAKVFVGQWGDFALTYDNGKSWSKTKIPYSSGSVYTANWGQNGCHFSGPTLDGKFSIDNILVQLKK